MHARGARAQKRQNVFCFFNIKTSIFPNVWARGIGLRALGRIPTGAHGCTLDLIQAGAILLRHTIALNTHE